MRFRLRKKTIAAAASRPRTTTGIATASPMVPPVPSPPELRDELVVAVTEGAAEALDRVLEKVVVGVEEVVGAATVLVSKTTTGVCVVPVVCDEVMVTKTTEGVVVVATPWLFVVVVGTTTGKVVELVVGVPLAAVVGTAAVEVTNTTGVEVEVVTAAVGVVDVATVVVSRPLLLRLVDIAAVVAQNA